VGCFELVLVYAEVLGRHVEAGEGRRLVCELAGDSRHETGVLAIVRTMPIQTGDSEGEQ